VEVTNSQLAYGYNLSLAVAIPPGVDILSGVSMIKFPYTTGTWLTLANPVNLPAGSNKWVFNISGDPNGVVILKGTDSIPKNGYRLRFRVLTNCNFTSGKSLQITASALNACGDGESRVSYSMPVVIDGLPTNVSLYVISAQVPASLPTCSDSSLMKIKVINLGPNAVSSIEKIGVNLDDAFDYSANSLTGIHNGPSGIASNITTGGIRYINFAIQPNLAINDSIVFSFKLNDIDPGSLHCDTLTVETTTLLVAQVNCSTAPTGSCLIQSITSATSSNVPVSKDNIAFGSYNAQSTPNGTTDETVTIHYRVKNTGAVNLNSGNLSVVFVHDSNQNGLPDETGADSLFSQVIPVVTLIPGDSVAMTASFSVPADKVCNMLAALKLNSNPCICSEVVLPVALIRIINAGTDFSTCANNPVQMGMTGVSPYTYHWIPSLYLNSSVIANPVFNFGGVVSVPTSFNYILQTTRPGDCLSRDTTVVTVYPAAFASAGNDTTVCPLSTVTMATSYASFHTSMHWTTGGDGVFDHPDSLHAGYTPGSTDILLGSATLTFTAQGPCGSMGDQVLVSLNALPVVTNSPLRETVCSAASPMITLTGTPTVTTFSWTASGSSGNVTGFGPGNGLVINQNLFNTGFDHEIVTYSITPSSPTCQGFATNYQVMVLPVSDVYFSPVSQVICSQQTTGINLLSHVDSTSFTWTAIAGSPAITGYSNGSGALISQTLLNTGTVTDSVVYTVTPVSFGCTPGVPQTVVVKVKPAPHMTNTITAFTQCSSQVTTILLQSNFSSSTFAWTATGSSVNVSGYYPGAGSSIVQPLVNTGFSNESVTYSVTPSFNGCTGLPTDFIITVYPVPNAYCIPTTQTVCSARNCTIDLMSDVAGANFTWTGNSISPFITGYAPGNGNQINQVLINTGLTGSVTYQITPFANGCQGTNTVSQVTVNPAPSVTQVGCFDLITTANAKPFLLRGGKPAGGVYAGTGVSNGYFNPTLAGSGLHHLTYTYSNIYLCDDSAHFTIIVQNNSFSCGGDLTDVRDGKKYKTAVIGGRCWMAQNLTHGFQMEPPSQPQTNNCLSEKYCLTNDPGCSIYGGLYQWDELMGYGISSANQGLCPPAWHVPSESEWQLLINSVAAGFIFPGDGVAAGFLKDPFLSQPFDALTKGIYYLNNTWQFMSDPLTVTMFWTSDATGANRSVARGMNVINTSVSRYEGSRGNAFPVRCVKDVP
jgi:uncharacterized protein (TIGR02145 family)